MQLYPMLRRRVLIPAVCLAFVLAMAPGAHARQLDPLKPRPPVHLAATDAAKRRIVLETYLTELERAIQSADTTALSVLVPDSVIPAVERASALRAGCTSASVALVRLAKYYDGRSRNPNLPLRRLRMRRRSLETGSGGGSSVNTDLLDTFDERKHLYAPLTIRFSASETAVRPVEVRGMTAGLCGLWLYRKAAR